MSIVLANFDGTFAGFNPRCLLESTKLVVLDMQRGLGLLASVFLLWSA